MTPLPCPPHPFRIDLRLPDGTQPLRTRTGPRPWTARLDLDLLNLLMLDATGAAARLVPDPDRGLRLAAHLHGLGLAPRPWKVEEIRGEDWMIVSQARDPILIGSLFSLRLGACIPLEIGRLSAHRRIALRRHPDVVAWETAGAA